MYTFRSQFSLGILWKKGYEQQAMVVYVEAAPKLYKGMMKHTRDRALHLFNTGNLLNCIEGGCLIGFHRQIWSGSYVIIGLFTNLGSDSRAIKRTR